MPRPTLTRDWCEPAARAMLLSARPGIGGVEGLLALPPLAASTARSLTSSTSPASAVQPRIPWEDSTSGVKDEGYRDSSAPKLT